MELSQQNKNLSETKTGIRFFHLTANRGCFCLFCSSNFNLIRLRWFAVILPRVADSYRKIIIFTLWLYWAVIYWLLDSVITALPLYELQRRDEKNGGVFSRLNCEGSVLRLINQNGEICGRLKSREFGGSYLRRPK